MIYKGLLYHLPVLRKIFKKFIDLSTAPSCFTCIKFQMKLLNCRIFHTEIDMKELCSSGYSNSIHGKETWKFNIPD